VVDAAGYMAEDHNIGDLKGVLLFDADPFINMMPALAKLPDTVSVDQIVAPPSFFNTFGNGTAQLLQARPDQFDGVMPVGGKHIDSMQSSNFLLQLVLALVDGPSTPKSREAVDTLAQTWIDDMYTDTPVTGTPGHKIDVGDATAVVLPTPTTFLTPVIEFARGRSSTSSKAGEGFKWTSLTHRDRAIGARCPGLSGAAWSALTTRSP